MDVVSTLRSGAVAESAAAMMQEKGFAYLRRSRHRLTPGTVKYAAFYVLSLEGSRGLTILEVADKIQVLNHHFVILNGEQVIMFRGGSLSHVIFLL